MERFDLIDLIVLIVVTISCAVLTIWLWKIRSRKFMNTKLFHLHKWRCMAVIVLIAGQIMELIECTMAEKCRTPFIFCAHSVAILYTILVTVIVRKVESRGFSGQSLYGVIVMNGALLIPKGCKWIWMFSDELLSQSPLFYIIGSVVLSLVSVNIMDVLTALAEKEPRFRFRDKSPSVNRLHNKNSSHFLSQITFSWISPLLWFGYLRKHLDLSNLGSLSEGDTCRVQYDLFQLNYKACSKSLWQCYFRSHQKFILLGGFLKLISDCLVLVGPISISYVMKYLSMATQDQKTSQVEKGSDLNSTLSGNASEVLSEIVQWEAFSSNGYFWAFLIFVSICGQSVMSQCSTHLINMVGIWIRNSLQGLIYRKALSISLFHQQKGEVGNKEDDLDVGKFTNLMVDDSFNVMSFFWIIHFIWAIPLKIMIVLLLLYWELGWSSVLGALLMMFCLVPLQLIVGKLMSGNMDEISKHSDERLKLLNEVLRSIKIIKLNCWESVFAKKINNIREKELQYFRIDSFYWTVISILIQIASGLLILTTLIIHFYGNDEETIPPTVSQIITCLALFNHLTIALFIFPLTVPVIISAIISTRRIEEFLNLPEVPSKNIGIQTIARILSRSDAHSDLIEDQQSMGGDQSGDESIQSSTLTRTKAFISKDPWVLKVGKMTLKGRNEEILSFDIRIPKYSLTVIIGPSGSGKSTFLSTILGEIPIHGDIQWDKCATTSYVSQTPWLISATIRENITFGEQFRTMQYRKIVECCELQQDFETISVKGDETEVGDNGTELSGGQQQRIMIARALYAPANVILMDDPFSALDDQVTNSIFNKAIKNLTMNKKRSIIMITQNMNVVKEADFIIVMDKGSVSFAGTYSESREKCGELFSGFEEAERVQNDSLSKQSGSSRTASEQWTLLRNIRRIRPPNLCDSFEEASSRRSIKRNSLFGSRHLTYEIPLPMDEYNDPDTVRLGAQFFTKGNDSFPNNGQRAMSLCIGGTQGPKAIVVRNISSPPSMAPDSQSRRFGSLRASFDRVSGAFRSSRKGIGHDSVRSNNQPRDETILEGIEASSRLNLDPSGGDKESDEEKSSKQPGNGQIGLKAMNSREIEETNQLFYWLFYFKKCGWILVVVFCVSSCFYQCLRIYADLWLNELVEDGKELLELRPEFNSYIILSVFCIILAVFSVPFGQYAGHMARRKIHDGLVKTLLNLPEEQVNIGQFIHRFANDVCVVDKKICPTSFRLLQFVLLWASAILINTYIVPWFLIITLPLALMYFFIQRFFSVPLNSLQKLESKTWEPIISNFAETLKGLTIIRAFNQESVFMDRFFTKLESNNLTFVIINAANRFLGIVLDFLGGVIVFIAIISALMTFDHSDGAAENVKIIGMAINYTLMVPIYMNWIVKLVADMDKYMDAIRRIRNDVSFLERIPAKVTIDKYLVPISWPQNGEIVFDQVTLSHKMRSSSTGPVLMDINLTIPAGQKIGICGRTGSGKSSFVSSLFGALDVNKGRILIDDVDIATIPLEELRARMAIISQDIVLFNGTLRDNLDPSGVHSELDIFNALEIAQLKDLVLFGGVGLEMRVLSDGNNLSQGQKQLICLARAILRSPVCLVLDEATSSLDIETEKRLLDAAMEAFQGRTIITVAHRLHTLTNYDRILVFEKGRLIRDGPTSQILPTLDTKYFE